MKYRCAHCGKVADKAAGHVNRARERGLNLYCGRKCSGLGRRDGKTKAQRVAEKAAYDAAYREKNRGMLKAKKHERYLRTYDPVEAAVYRKQRMPLHVEYCRQPEYKKWKREYDRQYRAKEFGVFAEAYLLSIDLNREIKGRMTNEEITQANGTQNKTQRRRRATSEEPQRGRKRHRERRAGHSAPDRW